MEITNMNITNMDILNNVNDLHIFWNILDYVKESPKKCYGKVIEHLNYNFSVQCNRYCSFKTTFFDNEFIRVPVLMRSSHGNCNICQGSVSFYTHIFCGYCSEKGTPEYNYYHSNCRGFNEKDNPITVPLPLDEYDNFLNLL
jgi:hypothetical protein